MHGVFEELFLVLADFPLLLVHQLAILIQRVRIIVLRIALEELAAFGLRLLDDLGSQRARKTSGLSEDHIPDIVGDHAPAGLPFLHLHHIHERQVLHILAERSH